MELREVIQKRRSVRAYTDVPAPRNLVNQLIESAMRAPSSCNLQLEQFIFIDDKSVLEKLGKEVSYKFKSTPSFIVVLHDVRFTVARYSGIMSAGMAVENILLSAVDLGLATCPMAGFTGDEKMRAILKIPKDMEILLIISIGYADTSVIQRPVPKIENEKIFHLNTFNNLLRLNTSPKLSDWSVAQVVEYRRRIAPVYLDRFRLNTYSEKLYEVAHVQFKKFLLPKINTGFNILDVLSYDGVWLKTMIRHDTEKKIKYSTADYLENNVNFLANEFNVNPVLINTQNEIESDKKYNIVTFVFQNEFTPELSNLLNSIFKKVDDGGHLFVVQRAEGLVVRAIKRLLIVFKKYIKKRPYNVYENNTFYKIGPKDHISISKMIKTAKNSGFNLVVVEKTDTGKTGEKVVSMLFQK